MPEVPGAPPGPKSPGAPPGGKRPAIGLQIKLPCATLDELKARYGDDLRQAALFIRTRSPRPVDTLVRLEVQLSTGAPAFRAAALVASIQPPPEPGMRLRLLGADEAGRALIAALGGRPVPPLKAEARPPAPGGEAAGPSSRPAPAAAPAPRPAAKAAVPSKAPMIGIDLGTTNSAAAVVKDGKPFVIPSREGYQTIPSIVAINEKGNVIVGHPAKSQLLINPANTIHGAKRLIGRQFSSPAVSDLRGRVPYQIIEGPRGEAAVQLGAQQFSLQQISALILTEVRQLAQQHLQGEVTRAVITVPAYYNDNQRNAVREAGELAGLKVARILNEPTAAALAFAHGRKLDQRVLVYDLGGGTFDASILELRGSIYEVVSTGGDTFLGGVDFDKVIVDHLLAVFREKNGIDFPGDRIALQRVADAAERAKIALSEQLEVPVKVPFVALVGDRPYDLEATLSRSELVLLTGHLVDRTLKVCEEVLFARSLKPADMAEVLLVGGQSRMPLVRERIRRFFGREPSKAVHPDEAVALGAAVLAQSIESGDIEGVVLVDVLAMSIGVGLPGGRFRPIIERNTSLPFKKALTIATTRDDQETLEVSIFQGDHEKAQENEYLGTLEIPGLPRGPRGSLSFDVVFSLSVESILTVTAEDKATGKSVAATFSTRDTPEAVRARLGDSSAPPARERAAGNGAEGGGLFGWLKRLFGGGREAAPRA